MTDIVLDLGFDSIRSVSPLSCKTVGSWLLCPATSMAAASSTSVIPTALHIEPNRGLVRRQPREMHLTVNDCFHRRESSVQEFEVLEEQMPLIPTLVTAGETEWMIHSCRDTMQDPTILDVILQSRICTPIAIMSNALLFALGFWFGKIS